jgi:hypothetical protein
MAKGHAMDIHRKRSWHLLVALVCGMAFLGAAAVRADDETSPAERAAEFVEDEAETIALFAHPTADFQEVTIHRTNKLRDGGFEVVASFNYVSAFGNEFYSKLALRFDEDGNYNSCRTVATNGVVGPFTAVKLVLDAVKELIKDDENLRDNPTVQDLIDKADAMGLVNIILKARQSK